MASELTGILFENLTNGIVLVDLTGEIRLINSKACKQLNVEKESVLGKRIDMLPLRTPLYKVLSENSREQAVEVSVNGLVLSVVSRECAGDFGSKGEIYELRDITPERQERRQREEFVAMMTHDLKSPLTVMMGYLQAIRGEMLGSVDATVKVCIDEVDKNAHRLLGMIEDVLDAYRLEVGLLRINKEYGDLRRVLHAAGEDFSKEAEAQGLSLSCTVDERIPPMKVDVKQLSRVFCNLVSNAIKFTPHGGVVSINALFNGAEVVVEICDSGIGISEEDQQRIFTKYFRAASVSGFKGTGLGLTISKAIVEAHGGSIDVSSTEGTGSCFKILLPLGN